MKLVLLFILAVFFAEVFQGAANTIFPHHEFQTPSIHPYKNRDELMREAKKDPFGFDTSQYKYSKSVMDVLRADPKLDGSEFKPAVMPVKTKFKTVDEHGIIQTHDINAKLFSGIVNLGEDATGFDVKCPDVNTLIVRGNMEQLKQFVPGTRLVVPLAARCSESQDTPLYRLVKRRSVVDDNTVRFDVEELDVWDMFEDVELDVTRELPKKTKYDKVKFGLFYFNFNPETRQCMRRDMPIYKDKYFNVVCTECYAYVEADVNIKMKINWRKGITLFRIDVLGDSKMVYDILGEAEYGAKFEVDKVIFKVPKGLRLSFSIGPVPLWVDFEFLLRVKGSFEFASKASLSFSGSFWDKLTLGMEYDAKRPKDQRFKYIKKNEHANWKDLIPKPKFKAHLDAKGLISIIPEVTVKFVSVTGVRLGFIPYLDGTVIADLELPKSIRNQCELNMLYYELNYGVKFFYQLTKLKVWKFETDLGGLLPYPKDPVNEYDLIDRTNIWKGCFKLIP